MLPRFLHQKKKDFTTTATIANGATESEAVDLGGLELAGIFVPDTFDGTAISVKVAPSLDGTYVTLREADSDFSVTVAASRYVPIENLALFAGAQYIKLVSGTAQATTDTTLTLALRPL